MKELAFPVQIRAIERLTLSTNGNPRFRLALDDMLSWADMAQTSSDYAFNYEIGNPGYRVGDWVYVTYSRAGRLTNIRKAEAPVYVQKKDN